MKRYSKLKMILLAGILVLCSGCGTSNKGKDVDSNKTVEQEDVTENYYIAISQFAQHGSLDNCRTGFLEGLKEEGIEEGKNLKVDYQNANAETGSANQIAQNFIANEVDLICAIATPSAQSAFNAALNTGIPVVYTAITDPVMAKLATEDKMPTGNATGTSDKLAVEEQLEMIRDVLPEGRRIGILYTTSEVNSESAIKEYKEAASKYGFEIVDEGITTASDIPIALDNLLKRVDCLNNLTDNTVVSALPTILDKANKKKIPVFGSEVEQVKRGCLATVGLDYIKLGKQTGKMAAKILKGEKKAEEMPYEIIEESSLYINTKVADDLKITLNDEYVNQAEEVFSEISDK